MRDPEFDLIVATAKGDKKAFESLVHRYQNALYNFIYRYVGDRYAAEDLTQETLLRVYRAAKRFKPQARVSSWIFKIAYRLSLNELKRRERFARFSEKIICRTKVYTEASAEGQLAEGETEREIMAALKGLSDNQRAALLLRVNDGLSYREIAEVLGVSVQSVESLIFRARRRLRLCLKGIEKE